MTENRQWEEAEREEEEPEHGDLACWSPTVTSGHETEAMTAAGDGLAATTAKLARLEVGDSCRSLLRLSSHGYPPVRGGAIASL